MILKAAQADNLHEELYYLKFKNNDMKRIMLLMVILTMIYACNQGRTSVKVSKTATRYEMLAEYPEQKTEKVLDVLKDAFKDQDSLLLNKNLSSGRELTLTNGAVFYLRFNPGKLEMELLNSKNDKNGLEFFDKMVREVKSAVN